MPGTQTFVDGDATGWITIDFLRGVTLLPLAQPVKDGSIHRARLSLGTIIPVHTHPADEYVMVLSGTVETGLAENPPTPRHQINAPRGKETPARRRHLTAFIGEYDVPHRHKCIGNSDSYLASQVIVATSGKTERIVVC